MKFQKTIRNLRNSNFFEYFYYFILISLMIIIFLGAILYFYFSKVIEDEAVKANNNLLQQIKNAQEIILSEIDKSIAGVVFDPLIYNYMDYYLSKDNIMLFNSRNKIENVVQLNQYIDSVYVYFQEEGLVLSSDQGMESINNFYDKDFLLNLYNKKLYSNNTYSRNKLDYYNKTYLNVTSFVKPIPINYLNKPKALIVFNMNMFALNNMINSMKINKSANIIICDINGNIITQKNKENNRENIVDSEYSEKMKSRASGYFYSGVGDKKVLVSFNKSLKYRWNYIYTISLKSLTAGTNTLAFVTFILCIIILLFSIIGSFFLSKRVYSPLLSIINLIRNQNYFSKDSIEDEEAEKETITIKRNINTLMDKNQNLQELLKDYDEYRKNIFLQSLIEGTVNSQKEYFEELNYYNIDIDLDGYFCVFIVSINKYEAISDSYSLKQKHMLFLYIQDIIKSEFFIENKGFFFEMPNHDVVIAVNLNKDSEIGEMKVIEKITSSFYSMISSSLKFKFTIGISSLQKGSDRLPKCFAEANMVLEHRSIIGNNKVIYFEDIVKVLENKLLYPSDIEKNIINSLKAMNFEKVKIELASFQDYLCQNSSSKKDFIRYCYLQLLSSSFKSINELSKDFEKNYTKYKETYLYLLNEESIEEMTRHISLIYSIVINGLEEHQLSRRIYIIEKVREYIVKSLGTDLSIDRIAEHFNMSSSYLRKLFKDESGITIKEFIDQARMNMVKELLVNKKYKIQDIAESVGYVSVSSFTRAFRLETGLTPGEYRKRNIKDE